MGHVGEISLKSGWHILRRFCLPVWSAVLHITSF